MTGLAWLLVVVAALVLPRRAGPHLGPGRRGGGRRDDPAGGAATVEEAAAAVALLAAALRSGAGVLECLDAVAESDPSAAGRELTVVAAAHRWGEPTEVAWRHVGPGWSAAATAWHAALSAGAAPAALLEEASTRMLRAEDHRRAAAAARAGVMLVLPLGACFLPGFVGTTVAPVVLRLVEVAGP